MLYIEIPKEYLKDLESNDSTNVSEVRTYDEVLEKYDVFLNLLNEVDTHIENITAVMNNNIEDPYYPELMQSCDKIYKSLIEKKTVYDNVCKVLAWMLKL